MTIQDKSVIDMIGWDAKSDLVALGISDHLDWVDMAGHISILTEKVNTYLEFVFSGQIKKRYPKYSGGPVEIRIYSKFQYPTVAMHMIERLQDQISRQNQNLTIKFIDTSSQHAD